MNVNRKLRDPQAGRLRMCEENGAVTWLDLRTGSFVVQASESRAERLRALIVRALKAREYQFQVRDGFVDIDFRGKSARYLAHFWADDPSALFGACFRFGSAVPLARRSIVTDLLNRVNHRIGFGTFDLDVSDGEVRFRFGADIDHLRFTTLMVDEVIGRSLAVCDRYHEAIMSVAFGDLEPADAMERFIR